MTGSVKLFWNAIKQPHMLRPVVFLFLFQVSNHKSLALALRARQLWPLGRGSSGP